MNLFYKINLAQIEYVSNLAKKIIALQKKRVIVLHSTTFHIKI